MISRGTLARVTHLLNRIGWFEIDELRRELDLLQKDEIQTILHAVVKAKRDKIENKRKKGAKS